MSKQYKVEQVEVVKQEGNRFTYGGYEYERIGPVHDCEVPFLALKVGDHFMWGGQEHIRIADIETGCPPYCGKVNDVSYKGVASGMGDNVMVKRVDCQKHHLTDTQRKNFEDTLTNIKQLQDDNYRAGQRLTTMQATVYTLYAHFKGEPGYGNL
jgi:hypothetical protein